MHNLTNPVKSPAHLDLRRSIALLEVALPLGFVTAAIVAAVDPTLMTSGNPFEPDFGATLSPPGWSHPFGTDPLGRDLFARTVYGARYSVLIGAGSVLLSLLVAIPLGLLAGVSGRAVDEPIARLLDIIAAFPELLLAILVIALLGPGLGNLVVAMGIAAIPKFARVTRAQTRAVMASGYVEHARLLGQARVTTIFRHVLPNAIGALPIISTLGLGYAIINAAGLSFMGLGPQPPTPEWGLMLSQSIGNLRVAWWMGFFPGAMITALVLSLTMLGKTFQARYERRHVSWS